MPLLETATQGEVQRMLDLFPVAALRQQWPDIAELSKTALCKGIAEHRPRAEVSAFVVKEFGCCKQHVHLYGPVEGTKPKLPATVKDGEQFKLQSAKSAFYLTRAQTDVVLIDPYEDGSIDFLWPLKVDITAEQVVIVSVIVLEKDIASYFGRKALIRAHGLSEETLVADIVQGMSLAALDIHRGVKKLWHSKYMDCFYTKYRKAKSSAYEIVDRTEKKGIRENDSELYEKLKKATMRQSVFHVAANQKTSVKHFGADLAAGTLSFTTYSDNATDTANVVRKILENN